MKKLLMMIMVITMSIGATTVYAGDGQGDGKSNLQLESSMPESGAKEVDVNSQIDLKFSNNVINMKVAENNLACFTLLDSQDNALEIEVLIGDDQMDPTVKNDVTVKPVKALEENESYRLVVSANMTAKNGMAMAEDAVIDFETVTTDSDSSIYVGISAAFIGIAIGYFFMKRKKSALK